MCNENAFLSCLITSVPSKDVSPQLQQNLLQIIASFNTQHNDGHRSCKDIPGTASWLGKYLNSFVIVDTLKGICSERK